MSPRVCKTLTSSPQQPPSGGARSEEAAGVVWVVDDDEAVRDSLGMLLESVGLRARLCESARQFLESFEKAPVECLVLDVRLPGMSGLELQRELAARDIELPIVFITGHGDVPMAVTAMRRGAVDFLEKPYKEQDLLDAVAAALDLDSRWRRESDRAAVVARRLESLTPRERQVLDLVVEGAANKVIASRLGASQRTIEIHRAHMMRKMKAESLAQLVRMVLQASAVHRR